MSIAATAMIVVALAGFATYLVKLGLWLSFPAAAMSKTPFFMATSPARSYCGKVGDDGS
jgi:hypothetical protein